MYRSKILFAGLAGTLMLGVAAEARAQTSDAAFLLERFQALCVDTLADKSHVRVSAEAGGWMPAPEGMFPAQEGIKNPEGWVLSSRQGMLFGFVADVEYVEAGEVMPMRACAIGSQPKPANFAVEIDRFGGGNRLSGFGDTSGENAYGFQIVNGEAKPAPAMATMATMRAILNGEMHIVLGQEEEDSVLVMYMVPLF